jgi:hypothetical protein
VLEVRLELQLVSSENCALEVLVIPRAKTIPRSRAEKVVRFISVFPCFCCFLSAAVTYCDLMNWKWQSGREGDSQFREIFQGAERAGKTGVNTEDAEGRGEKLEVEERDLIEGLR